MNKHIVLFFCLVVLTLFLNAGPFLENDIYIDSAKSTSMGGFHVGLAEDMDVLFSNPAGFKAVDEQIRFSNFTIGLHGPVFDITNLVVQAIDGDQDPEDIIAEEENLALLRSLYANASFSGPLAFSYVGNGIGFGIFNNSSLLFHSPNPFVLEAQLWEQIVLVGGYTFTIPLGAEKHVLETGITLKGFFRGEERVETTYLQLITILQDADWGFLREQPFDLVTGIGFDVGVRYTFKSILTFGLVGQDLYTPTIRRSYGTYASFADGEDPVSTKNGLVPMKINTGLSVTPPLGPLRNYISKVSISLDYHDIFDFLMYPEIADNPILHLGAGTEITILDILSLRGGFNEGLFSAGLGVKLGIADVGLSMYGKELSHEPGLNPVYNVLLSIDIES